MTARPLHGRSPWPSTRTAETRYEDPVERQPVPYRCRRGHVFEVPFVAGILPPAEWDCRCGAVAELADARPSSAAQRRPSKRVDEDAGHCLVMVLQRRSRADLEAALTERAAELRAERLDEDPGQSHLRRTGGNHMIVYLSVGNREGKLTQEDWHSFWSDIAAECAELAAEVHDTWFASALDQHQSACWCLEFASDADADKAKAAAMRVAQDWRQGLVTWAVVHPQIL